MLACSTSNGLVKCCHTYMSYTGDTGDDISFKVNGALNEKIFVY